MSIYERISGVKLNLAKSTIIPMDDGVVPAWYGQTDCHVARPTKIIVFLGCPIGV